MAVATFARAVVVVPAAVAAVGGRAVHLLADAVAAAPEPLDARACARRHDITRFTTTAKTPTTMGSYSVSYSALTAELGTVPGGYPGYPAVLRGRFKTGPSPWWSLETDTPCRSPFGSVCVAACVRPADAWRVDKIKYIRMKSVRIQCCSQY